MGRQPRTFSKFIWLNSNKTTFNGSTNAPHRMTYCAMCEGVSGARARDLPTAMRWSGDIEFQLTRLLGTSRHAWCLNLAPLDWIRSDRSHGGSSAGRVVPCLSWPPFGWEHRTMCFCWFRDKKFKFKFAELLRLSIYGLFYIEVVNRV